MRQSVRNPEPRAEEEGNIALDLVWRSEEVIEVFKKKKGLLNSKPRADRGAENQFVEISKPRAEEGRNT